MKKRSGLALAVGAAGLVSGVVAERAAVRRRHECDLERDAEFGSRRGERSRTIRLRDGAGTFVEEVGPRRARRGVVFVNGSALRTDMWHYQLAGLGGHRLVFYDLRGHGASGAKGEADYSIRQLADDLLEVIEDCKLDEVVIVGHSVGGMIGMQLCLDHPELVDRVVKGLVLCNSTYGPAIETFIGGALIARVERLTRRPFDGLLAHSRRIDYLRRIVKPSDAMFWGVAFAAFGPKASARQIDFVYDMVAETSSDVIFELVKSYRDFDARGRLDEIGVPVLIIGGEHDRLTLPEASEYLADHLPKAELHILEGAGHMSMLERYERVNEMLERFFDDVLGRPKTGAAS